VRVLALTCQTAVGCPGPRQMHILVTCVCIRICISRICNHPGQCDATPFNSSVAPRRQYKHIWGPSIQLLRFRTLNGNFGFCAWCLRWALCLLLFPRSARRESGFHLKRKLKNVQACNANNRGGLFGQKERDSQEKMKENNEQPGINQPPPFSTFSALFFPRCWLNASESVINTNPPGARKRRHQGNGKETGNAGEQANWRCKNCFCLFIGHVYCLVHCFYLPRFPVPPPLHPHRSTTHFSRS